eukprot:gene32604-40232_t
MAWIKSTLSESGDLRPEVRNGLSMIMIYAFGTAKAACEPGLDMFNALQDVNQGLAIVNKTSLKIYNDPYFYYEFLKSCISGLIDAGKIPENERTNHPKKPKTPMQNDDELIAFLKMKNILVGLFNSDAEQGRARIAQITAVWTEKHKNIRNNWFTTAMNVLTRSETSVVAGVSSLLNPALLFNLDTSLMSSPNINSLLRVSPMRDGESGTTASTNKDPSLQLPVPSAVLPISPPPVVVTRPLHNTLGMHNASSSYSTTSSVSSSKSNSPAQKVSRPIASAGGQDGRASKAVRTIISSAPPTLAISALPPSITAMRFERVGPKEWDCKESKIYNIESLVLHNSSVFCLVDESRLSVEERAQKKVVSQSGGIGSLQAELQQRGALVTSWPKVEHSRMLSFLESVMAQQSGMSLQDAWTFQAIGGNTSDPRWTERRGGGVLAYEVVMQVGIVVRKNEALGITEDCWRLVYPRVLEKESSSGATFSAFLCKFFPQLRSIFGKLDLESLAVKYSAHKMDPPLSSQSVPVFDATTVYQTVGCLDEPCIDVLASFEMNDLCFHDLVLIM